MVSTFYLIGSSFFQVADKHINTISEKNEKNLVKVFLVCIMGLWFQNKKLLKEMKQNETEKKLGFSASSRKKPPFFVILGCDEGETLSKKSRSVVKFLLPIADINCE